jgi:hypothetical protein
MSKGGSFCTANGLPPSDIILTRLKADALATTDWKLAAVARAFAEAISPADILRP